MIRSAPWADKTVCQQKATVPYDCKAVIERAGTYSRTRRSGREMENEAVCSLRDGDISPGEPRLCSQGHMDGLPPSKQQAIS